MASEAAGTYTSGSHGDEGKWSSSEEAVQNAIRDDPELTQIASRLDSDVIIDPDRDLNIETISDTTSDAGNHVNSNNKDSDSISTGSSLRDPDEGVSGSGSSNNSPKINSSSERRKSSASTSSGKPVTINGEFKSTSDSLKTSEESLSKSASVRSKTSKSGDKSSEKSGEKSKNPLRMLKKLTKFDKPVKKTDFMSEFAAVVVDRLPQVFVVKYLGHRKVSGVCGLHHVRKPVDEMVRAVKDKLDGDTEVELPLVYVVVSPKGLDLRDHKSNKVTDGAPLGLMPIDFISYGVQDIKYWRVFTCIVVRELSARTRVATCHAFLTDSSHNGRKMALALGAAFNVYSSKLKAAGKVHNFQVELRPPDQLADAVTEEFEA